ncbi:hypothetical protein LTR78_003498 [Recurvomyces mirabilis]|uniref:Uncharacterized protein n=1 Tax=Recurvomyces mirabilis TaxID=574656 RepID=A0AAE0WRK1_9PEZI|nr:hypothetical protein LTR78_003498 [Recurvomyces mirabilis]KAK5154469.1 hypothetical protein LTS14_006604 [Recurvomyces mirabilis]
MKTQQADAAEPSTRNADATKDAATTERYGGENPSDVAPTNANDQSASPKARRRSSIFSKKTNGNKEERKQSLSDSGPYIFAFDPRVGKTVLQKNPHWPYEDSWKREEDKATSQHYQPWRCDEKRCD